MTLPPGNAPGFVAPEFLFNTTTQGSQSGATITALPDGGFVIAWQDDSETGGDTSGYAIHAQILDPDPDRLVDFIAAEASAERIESARLALGTTGPAPGAGPGRSRTLTAN